MVQTLVQGEAIGIIVSAALEFAGEHKVRRGERNAVHALRARRLARARFRGLGAPGWISRGNSGSGASASITRSGGKVTTTSVPSRSFDFSMNLPPCMSTRPLHDRQAEAGALLGRLDGE